MVRIMLETRRNLFHLILGILVVASLYFEVLNIWVILVGTLVGFVISAARRKRRIPLIDWFLLYFEREQDIETFPGRGALFFFLGTLLSLAIFPRDIAIASIIIVVLGDSISPLVGARAGRVRHPLSEKKFLEGSIVGFFFAFLGALLFVSPVEAFLASIFAMTIEAVDSIKSHRIEDNITMPLAAGLAITIFRTLF